MKRREFITLLGGASAWPLAARAQQPIIGLVSIGASPTDAANFRPFLAQMRELGYVDGQNVTFDRRFTRCAVARRSVLGRHSRLRSCGLPSALLRFNFVQRLSDAMTRSAGSPITCRALSFSASAS
jgi:pimeloyl-ACP methyl ester carboxylesterase